MKCTSRYLSGFCFAKLWLCSFLIALSTVPSFSQAPKELQGKWEGKIKLTLDKKIVNGKIALEFGNPGSKTPVKVDISLERPGDKEIKQSTSLSTTEVKFSVPEVAVRERQGFYDIITFKSNLPDDNNDVCTGIFNFIHSHSYVNTNGGEFTFVLLGDFDPLYDCSIGKVEFTLFKQSYLKELAKKHIPIPELSRILPNQEKKTAAAVIPLVKDSASKINTAIPKTTNSMITSEKGLSEGASVLFKGVKSAISVKDQNQIFSYSDLRLADEKNGFLWGEGKNNFISDLEVLITDLNGDRIEEVLIYFKSLKNGTEPVKNVIFFVKNKKDDIYDPNFSMQRDKPLIIPRYSGGYPDLFFYASSGNTDYVLSWYGTRYEGMDEETVVNRNALNRIKTIPFDHIAKTYQEKGYLAARDLQNSLPKISNASYLGSPQGISLPQAAPRKVYSKTSSSKFIGKYWQLGYYNSPFTISKSGNLFYLKSPVQSKVKLPGFSYNTKADRLEAWTVFEGLKFKILITFDYEAGGVFIYPENRSLQGMFPTHLNRY